MTRDAEDVGGRRRVEDRLVSVIPANSVVNHAARRQDLEDFALTPKVSGTGSVNRDFVTNSCFHHLDLFRFVAMRNRQIRIASPSTTSMRD
jgi:hypothetical protein